MCAEVEVVPGVAPAERTSVGAHLRRAFHAVSGPDERVGRDGVGSTHAYLRDQSLDPRHVHVVGYYVHRFREVGQAREWSD